MSLFKRLNSPWPGTLLWLGMLLAACVSNTTQPPTRPVEQIPTLSCDDGTPAPRLDVYPSLADDASLDPVDYEQARRVIAALRHYSAEQTRAYIGVTGIVAILRSQRQFTHRCLDAARARGIIH